MFGNILTKSVLNGHILFTEMGDGVFLQGLELRAPAGGTFFHMGRFGLFFTNHTEESRDKCRGSAVLSDGV